MYRRSWIVIIAVLAAVCLRTGAFGAKTKAAPKPTAKITLPRIVDVGAEKCIPCKMMVPVLDQLKKEYKGKLQVEFVDIYKNPAVAQKYAVRMIPTQILFDGRGKEIARHVGFWAKQDILAEFKKHGIKLVANLSPPKKK